MPKRPDAVDATLEVRADAVGEIARGEAVDGLAFRYGGAALGYADVFAGRHQVSDCAHSASRRRRACRRQSGRDGRASPNNAGLVDVEVHVLAQRQAENGPLFTGL